MSRITASEMAQANERLDLENITLRIFLTREVEAKLVVRSKQHGRYEWRLVGSTTAVGGRVLCLHKANDDSKWPSIVWLGTLDTLAMQCQAGGSWFLDESGGRAACTRFIQVRYTLLYPAKK